MEDDEEIHSHPSPGSESPPSPHHNDRISVTVAAAAPSPHTPHPPQESLTLALPIQQSRTTTGSTSGGGSAGGGGGREDCWSEGATSVLIDAWGERYLELSRGNLKQKHWKEVADIVSSREDYSKPPKTDIQCKNRIDTVKKKYKIEKTKIASGGPPSKWPFFHRLERLIGPTTAKTPAPPSASSSQKVPVGIPVGVRPISLSHYHQQNQLKQQFSPPLSQNPPRFSGTYDNNTSKQPFRKRPLVADSDSEPDDHSPDSMDSFPPETYMRRKTPRVEFNNYNAMVNRVVERDRGDGGGGGKEKEKEKEKLGWGESVRELTNAILKFGEAYEQAESAKLQQMVEMEKQRMKFAKELELQRMKFLMKTQMELSQLSRNSSSKRVGEGNNHHNNNSNDNIINNSDSSN